MSNHKKALLLLGSIATVFSAPMQPSLSLTQQLLLSESAIDRYNLLPNDTQFVFDFNAGTPDRGKGGDIVIANRKTFPALVGTGASMAVGRIGPCGINTLHVHPRSSELQMVIEGRLVVEMNPENGVLNANGTRRIIRGEIGPYQMTPFYQGSIHTQFNPDCANTMFVASFASEDFGTEQVIDGSLAFSNDIVAATFGQIISGENIDFVRNSIPANIALGVEQCLRTCGIQKRSRYKKPLQRFTPAFHGP
ncbi:cupin [Purpureocillium lilacinum]|uniref:Cupin n=1 Tax=Purpureocillium lilacinum TaxID=33203 RepID=A0A179GA68_PURLI|nr:cupin [Purpureocillium lilacinum]